MTASLRADLVAQMRPWLAVNRPELADDDQRAQWVDEQIAAWVEVRTVPESVERWRKLTRPMLAEALSPGVLAQLDAWMAV